ncbi:MAG: cysteine synthase family protein [Deltaproteobacteria bacterium]|jgi:cysteine synthase B|nr:cysteine synthase family protein [Deltaproteobacteria bacterium]
MNVCDLVGRTPLLDLSSLSPAEGVGVWAKAEFCNPSGSVKDRAARAMLAEGLRSGRLGPEKAVLDSTSGNTGIAYAMLGAALKRRVVLHMPANANRERKALLGAYGAEVVETDPLEGSDGAYLSAKKAYENDPDEYFFPNQYDNPENHRAHYLTTGPEIWGQTGGGVTHFVCSVGTGGTFMGVSSKLKSLKPEVRAVLVQPDSPLHGIEGTKHLASTIKPGIFDRALPDEVVTVSTEEAIKVCRRLAGELGVLAGVSAGANVAAALRLAGGLPPGSLVTTVLGDGGARYLSDGLWDKA